MVYKKCAPKLLSIFSPNIDRSLRATAVPAGTAESAY